MSSDGPGSPHDSAPDARGNLQELRHILLREDEAYLTETVQTVLAEATAARVDASKDEMAEALAPVLGQAIRVQLKESQADIIDALYPIIGKAIQRAVAEAMRSLAQRVDEGLRSTFSLKRVTRRVRARMQGIPESELLMREALPYQVQEVFVIHRDSGVLLEHLSRDPAQAKDSDLIGSMLTAIRDFAEDTFGTEHEGGLGQIQYDDLSILIEPGPSAYLAVVVEGFEPEDLRHRMRTALSAIHRDNGTVLEKYDGDASRLEGVEAHLHPLLADGPPGAGGAARQRSPWLALGGVAAALVLCASLGCLGAWWLAWGRPTPTVQALAPTATATATSTATPVPPTLTDTASPTVTSTPTSTPSPTQTPEPSATEVPTATSTPRPAATPPYVGVMIGNVRLRAEPQVNSEMMGVTVDQARPVEILAIYEDWYLIRWPPGQADGSSGWVPGRWVGVFGAPPTGIITPEP